jgi:hypothetical protein
MAMGLTRGRAFCKAPDMVLLYWSAIVRLCVLNNLCQVSVSLLKTLLLAVNVLSDPDTRIRNRELRIRIREINRLRIHPEPDPTWTFLLLFKNMLPVVYL